MKNNEDLTGKVWNIRKSGSRDVPKLYITDNDILVKVKSCRLAIKSIINEDKKYRKCFISYYHNLIKTKNLFKSNILPINAISLDLHIWKYNMLMLSQSYLCMFSLSQHWNNIRLLGLDNQFYQKKSCTVKSWLNDGCYFDYQELKAKPFNHHYVL